MNIFDKEQPYFWIGALIIPENTSSLAEEELKPLLKYFDTKELHGNQLGIGRISEVSKRLIKTYNKLDAKFLFVRVEKGHIASMKFVDTLIDSGHNPAIPHLYYASRGTRLLLAHPIATMLSEGAKQIFWDIFRNHKVEDYIKFLRDFKSTVSIYIPDPRLREILYDALDFGIRNPERLLDDCQGEYESPNLVAFSSMLDGLKNVLPNSESKITTIIHDEQNQFARYLKEMFDILKNFSVNQKIVGYPEVKITETYTEQLSFLSSHDSAGLQLIDVPLWLLKQVTDNDKVLTGDASLLLDYIKENGYISHFSYETLTLEAIKMNEEIMSRSFTEQELQAGLAKVQELEKVRKSNLIRGMN